MIRNPILDTLGLEMAMLRLDLPRLQDEAQKYAAILDENKPPSTP